MRTAALYILGVVVLEAIVVLAIVGCDRAACPGFAKVNTGSGCRKVSTGEYVVPAYCEECGA